MKVKEIINIIENDGWILERINGSHRHFTHNIKLGLVTVPGKLSSDLAIGTLKSIYKQAGLKR
jgi:predicted RNA binding protein YcfA (HicA-like mRNA interferase family)